MQIQPIITKELNIMAKYLTDTEQEFLDAITSLYEDTGVLPANKEIAKKFTQNREAKGEKSIEYGRSFVSQYLQRLHEKGHIVYEDGRVTNINISNVLNIDYVFKKLEWLSSEYQAGRLTKSQYERYTRLLDKKTDEIISTRQTT